MPRPPRGKAARSVDSDLISILNRVRVIARGNWARMDSHAVLDPAQLKTRRDFALEAAREAARLILSYYQRTGLAVELKSDRSPVTAADRGAEELIRDGVAQAFPDDGFLGEESGERESRNGFRWIVDPLDGTKSFVHGVPLFGTLVGVEFSGRMAVGVCRLPVLDEVVGPGAACGCVGSHLGLPVLR